MDIRKFDEKNFLAVIRVQINYTIKFTHVSSIKSPVGKFSPGQFTIRLFQTTHEKSNLEDELNRFKGTIFPEEAPGY